MGVLSHTTELVGVLSLKKWRDTGILRGKGGYTGGRCGVRIMHRKSPLATL